MGHELDDILKEQAINSRSFPDRKCREGSKTEKIIYEKELLAVSLSEEEWLDKYIYKSQ